MKLSDLTTALRSRFARGVLAVLGVIACGVIVHHAGTRSVVEALLRVGHWVPLLLGLELGRAGFELLSTRAVLGHDARNVPLLVMLRAHLAAHAISTVLPLGRSVGEMTKATLIAPYVSAARAAAVGASGQIIALAVNGAIGVVGGAAAIAFGSSLGMALIFLGYGAVLGLVAYGVAFGARSEAMQRVLGRLLGDAKGIDAFATQLRSSGALGSQAFAAQAAGKVCQALQLGVLSFALGQPDGLSTGPLLLVIYIAGASVGDLLPAQLGAVEGAFALTAPLLAMSTTTAVALGLTLHAVQLSGAALTALLAAALARGGEIHPQRHRSTPWEIRSELH